MFKIYADGVCIYDDTKSSNTELQLVNPKLALADNSAGTFTATIPTTNIGYDLITRLKTTITIFRNEEWLWEGRVLSENQDFWNNRKITCEGVLAYLNDTNQIKATYEHVTIESFLTSLLNRHNAKVDSDRQIYIGNVTVVDQEDPLTSYETDFDSTLTYFNNVLDMFGGHMMIRKENGINYLDYLSLSDEDPGRLSSQTIDFGQNLLDFTRKFEAEDFATVLLPLGAQADNGDYVTVEKVNDGSIYVPSEDAVTAYGWIEKVIHWDNVAMPWRLMQKAEEYLSDIQFNSVVIELKAIDLNYIDPNITPFALLDVVRVISRPHGMDREFPITKIDMPLDSPENIVYTLGGTIQESLTTIQKNSAKKTNEKIEGISETIISKVISDSISEESTNASQIIIGNDSNQIVSAFSVSPTENTSVVFNAEITHETATIESITEETDDAVYTETDCEIFASYEIDGVTQNYRPLFTEYDGGNTIHLLYHFTVKAATTAQLVVRLHVSGGTLDIPAGGIRSYIIGTAQMEPGEWGTDGMNVYVSDNITGIITEPK